MTSSQPTLAAELRRALGRAHRRLRSQVGDAHLPYPLFSALTVLMREGAMTPGRLAERECVQPPTITRTVNALAGLGLVSKAPDPSDGRQVLVSLTPAGEAEVRETRRRRETWLTSRLSRMTAEDRAVLARAAELLEEIAAS